ncbi:hypothetical protein FLA4_01170 [Candidatus Rickettsia kotlanii]|nr:hypothetical protein FLA4_01170 [Candidatus Rickettsia kotlanii]BDU60949.1 hypothetical protein HM2_01170 [Candidatus Rickettsia kotlanii]
MVTPDWVGMEVLNEKWSSLIKDCAKYYTGKQARLWSFEAKKIINRSNLRESFFRLYQIPHGHIMVI